MRKWLNWIALVIVFAVACGFLSNWQFSRREQKLAAIQLVLKNYSTNPVELSELSSGLAGDLSALVWRQVKISGHYLPDATLLVRNRPNDGQPGFEELVPFKTDVGKVIFISRGWLPSGDKQDYPDDVPLPNPDQLTIVGRILATEPILNRGAPKGQIATINLKLATKLTGLNSTESEYYLRLVSESPSGSKSLKPMPSPSIEEGNNLSYALQWILFGLMAMGALIWRIRKDAQEAAGIQKPKRIKHSDRDAEFEDSATRAK